MGFWKFTKANILMFFRDKRAVFFSLFLPVFIMIIFGLADFEKFAAAKVGIIDKAQNEQSRQLVKNLQKIEIISTMVGSEEELKTKLENGDLDLILKIPQELIRSKMIPVEIPGLILPPGIEPLQEPEFEETKLSVYINQARILQAQNALTVLKEAFRKLNFEVTNTKEIFTFEEISITDREIRYVDFLIPGIVALAIMQMSIMSIIFIIVGYREKGILKRLQTTPISSFDFIVSQVITRLIVSIVQAVLIILLAIILFKFIIIGNYGLILLATVLGAIVFIAMGLVISAVAKTQNTAAPLANVFILPMMFLGDVFFPVSTMPQWLQNVVGYLPLNYLSDALRKIMIEGATLSNIQADIYGLLAWSAIMVIVASLTFHWKTTD